LIKNIVDIVDIPKHVSGCPVSAYVDIHSHRSIYATGARRSILVVIKWTRCPCYSFLIALST